MTVTETDRTLDDVSAQADALGAQLLLLEDVLDSLKWEYTHIAWPGRMAQLAAEVDSTTDHLHRLEDELAAVLREETEEIDRLYREQCDHCDSADDCRSNCGCPPCEAQRALDDDADSYFFDCD